MDIWATLQNDDYGSSRVLGFVYGLAAHILHTNGLVNDSQTPNKFLTYECKRKKRTTLYRALLGNYMPCLRAAFFNCL